MKTYHISVNGQQYEVQLEDLYADPVRVRVNGQSFQVSVREQKPGPVRTETRASSELDLTMDAYVPAVTVAYQDVEPEEGEGSAVAAQAAAEGSVTISAPMPGTILDIAVKAGERVSQGDTLCNLEAMKMKSPIRAPEEGTVAQVLISEGQNVGYGDVLFTLA